MAERKLPLNEVSINDLFNGDTATFEIPIYQRNYAWESDEISALVQDVYDAYKKDKGSTYYIGTLVSFYKGDQVYEVIDGQQRLTTIRLILGTLDVKVTNKITYRARKKADDTLDSIPDFQVDEKDSGIENGFKYAKRALEDIVSVGELAGYRNYFLNRVHLIHYQVSKDVDLNQYFEVMNSRGEQLEMHEIVKARLMQRLEGDEERQLFHEVWDACSEMGTYVQQNIDRADAVRLFKLNDTESILIPENYNDVSKVFSDENRKGNSIGMVSLEDIINPKSAESLESDMPISEEMKDSFQPIIDFPNFLLIVLKLYRMDEPGFVPSEFNLDDKELLHEFDRKDIDVRKFAYTLLKARFLLDNYVVHHSKEEDTVDSNPWKLQVWYRSDKNHGLLRNLCADDNRQMDLVQLLSMFEVAFTPRQRKNYLFYCLFYLIRYGYSDLENYRRFVRKLADLYFQGVYLKPEMLNAKNTPLPGSFDSVMLEGNALSHLLLSREDRIPAKGNDVFNAIYGDGTFVSNGVSLFVFNYLDYRIWKLYAEILRGGQYKEESSVRSKFFQKLGCSDFGLNVFDLFYFSRTRRSLEHFYAQANATGKGGALDEKQINCFGNYAMIGSEANSSGSNWMPTTKLAHYLDASGKINMVSVASLKFMIMMQNCRDEGKWDFDQLKEHQEKMVSLMME